MKDQLYVIGIANLIDDQLNSITYYKGFKKEIIELINKDILKRYVDSFLKAKILVNLAFDEEEYLKSNSNYLKDLSDWYSLEELEEIGALKLI